ncbi:hypothetical protein CARUB_v10012088mg [Capsella rubella]|uniref:Transmembrane protein n=1 Tax=Capsella rubella TaxID=81985 RepID=R0IKS4_9BRAS|nr:hypothetical protein CARUB_v10012088mg [Capsella rubella]
MESPLLNKSEHNVDVTTSASSSSNDEHVVDMTNDEESSLPTDDQTPFEAVGVPSRDPFTEENVMNLVEFVLTFVQIVAAIVGVTRADDKHKEDSLFIWINVYTGACIVTLLILCGQLWNYNVSLDSRSPMARVKKLLEQLFVCLFVAFLWISFVNSSPVDHTSPLFWLCVAFIAFSCIRYVLPNLKCTTFCLAFVCLSWVTAFQEGVSPNMVLIGGIVMCILGIISTKYSC